MDLQDVHVTRALHGAECNINRRIIRSVVQLKIRLLFRTKKQLNRSPFKGLFCVFELQAALASAIDAKPSGMRMGAPTGTKLTENGNISSSLYATNMPIFNKAHHRHAD